MSPFDCKFPDPERCKAQVLKRDTYRVSRLGGRFKMYYSKCQCSRKPVANGYCWQHGAATGERYVP